jgi:hypothetical protein
MSMVLLAKHLLSLLPLGASLLTPRACPSARSTDNRNLMKQATVAKLFFECYDDIIQHLSITC